MAKTKNRTLTLGMLLEQLQKIAAEKPENKDLPVFVESTLEESFEELHEVEACQIGAAIPYTKGDPPQAFEEDADEDNEDNEDGAKSSFPFLKLVTWN